MTWHNGRTLWERSQSAKARINKLKGKPQNKGICSTTTQSTPAERAEKERRQSEIRAAKRRQGERPMPQTYLERRGFMDLQSPLALAREGVSAIEAGDEILAARLLLRAAAVLTKKNLPHLPEAAIDKALDLEKIVRAAGGHA